MGFPVKDKHDAIEPMELLYKGEFSYEMVYKLIYFWLTENGFVDVDGAGDKFEHLYFENIFPGGGAKELWHYWRVKKQEDEFFTYYINVDTHVLGMSKEEKVVDGKKIKTNKLEMSIFFSAVVVPEGGSVKLKGDKFTEWLRPYFYDNLYRKRVKERKDDLYDQVHELINSVKQHLGLYLDTSLQKPFHNPFGIPQFK